MWDEPALPPALPSSPRSPTTAMAEIDAAKQWESDWNEVEVAAAVADQIASEEHALAMAEAMATGLGAMSIASPPPSATAELPGAPIPIPPPAVPAAKKLAVAFASDIVSDAGVIIERHFFASDGTHPNNERYPLLLYRQVCTAIEVAMLESHGWSRPMPSGSATDHVYYSTTWVALLCMDGEADVQFGGPLGPCLRPMCGDLVLVPPGVPRLVHGEGASGFTMLVSYPRHDGGHLPTASGEGAEVSRGPASPLDAVNIVTVPPPFRCPRYGDTPPWAGGFARLFLHPTHKPSAIAEMASQLQQPPTASGRTGADEKAPQRVARPEVPVLIIGPLRGAGKQRKLPDGTWEYPRRNVVYARCDGGATIIELGCGDLRVVTVADLKRWIATRPGQLPSGRMHIHLGTGGGAELEDVTTLHEAGVDYESEVTVRLE